MQNRMKMSEDEDADADADAVQNRQRRNPMPVFQERGSWSVLKVFPRKLTRLSGATCL